MMMVWPSSTEALRQGRSRREPRASASTPQECSDFHCKIDFRSASQHHYRITYSNLHSIKKMSSKAAKQLLMLLHGAEVLSTRSARAGAPLIVRGSSACFSTATKASTKPKEPTTKPPGAIAVESAVKAPKAPVDDKCGPLPDDEDDLADMVPMIDPKTGAANTAIAPLLCYTAHRCLTLQCVALTYLCCLVDLIVQASGAVPRRAERCLSPPASAIGSARAAAPTSFEGPSEPLNVNQLSCKPTRVTYLPLGGLFIHYAPARLLIDAPSSMYRLLHLITLSSRSFHPRNQSTLPFARSTRPSPS
jgi:hypothetical protein